VDARATQRKDWLALVAVHSDAWLMAVAFYYGAKFDARKRCVRTRCGAMRDDDARHGARASVRDARDARG